MLFIHCMEQFMQSDTQTTTTTDAVWLNLVAVRGPEYHLVPLWTDCQLQAFTPRMSVRDVMRQGQALKDQSLMAWWSLACQMLMRVVMRVRVINCRLGGCYSAFRRGGPANQCKRITRQHHMTKHEIKVHNMYEI